MKSWHAALIPPGDPSSEVHDACRIRLNVRNAHVKCENPNAQDCRWRYEASLSWSIRALSLAGRFDGVDALFRGCAIRMPCIDRQMGRSAPRAAAASSIAAILDQT